MGWVHERMTAKSSIPQDSMVVRDGYARLVQILTVLLEKPAARVCRPGAES